MWIDSFWRVESLAVSCIKTGRESHHREATIAAQAEGTCLLCVAAETPNTLWRVCVCGVQLYWCSVPTQLYTHLWSGLVEFTSLSLYQPLFSLLPFVLIYYIWQFTVHFRACFQWFWVDTVYVVPIIQFQHYSAGVIITIIGVKFLVSVVTETVKIMVLSALLQWENQNDYKCTWAI